MGSVVNLVGEVVGRLLVLERGGSNKAGATWVCLCECGAKSEVASGKLRSGHTQSCGCLKREKKPNLKHGHANKSRTYRTWKEMRQRCNNQNTTQYKWYGGKGIGVCADWDDYLKFLEDMGERPEGKTLDRIDPDKGYSKENCRWATSSEQAETNRGCFQLGHIPWNSKGLAK